MFRSKFLYECVDCGHQIEPGKVIYLCPDCHSHQSKDQPPRGVLRIVYNYQKLQNNLRDFKSLKARAFIDLLPLTNLDNWPDLKIGQTPLYHKVVSDQNTTFDLFLKDDSQNPSYSFKDRASALVSAYARENGINTIIAASTGNAGSSIASICASQGQKAIVLVPASAPKAKLAQIMMYGAVIVAIKGSYDDAFELSKRLSDALGFYNRNTAYNPLTIEGKKTVAFELFEQMEESIPDNIFVPVGDGVIISGVFKGYEELMKLGWINKIPRIIGVQSANSDNLVRNIATEEFNIKSGLSVADSITVDIPRNFFMTKKFIEKYRGEMISVSDQSIIEASMFLSKRYGLFAEPAAAAAMAGLLKYQQKLKIQAGTKNIVLLTGSGLKDLKALEQKISLPEPLAPDLNSIMKYLDD